MSEPKRVMWADNDNPYYLGRNGEGQMQGIQVSNFNNGFSVLHIEPINSKGQAARCVMTVPLANIGEFITALKAARGIQVGDMVRLKVPVKGTYKYGSKEVGWLAEGALGKIVERMDDPTANLMFESECKRTIITHVSADEVEWVG